MKTTLLYGFLMALGGLLLNLLFFFLGFHASAEKMQSTQWLGALLGLGIAIACVVLGTRERRELWPAGKDWGYGSALGSGTLIALWSALFAIVATYLYFAFINPHMSEIITQMQLAKLQAKGVSGDQLDRAEAMMHKTTTPGVIAVFGFVQAFIVGFSVSLFGSKCCSFGSNAVWSG